MKNFLPLILVAVGAVLLMSSCDSRRNDTGINALGIHSIKVKGNDIKSISVVREADGVKIEWLDMVTEGNDLSVHIQLGLPGKTMRLAIGGKSVAKASSFELDIIREHPFSFSMSAISRPGEYVLMETQDENLTRQNKILLIAK